MDNQSYVQSFSHGQITIPKQVRDKLGLSGKFWLKMYLDGNKLVFIPTQQDSLDMEEYRKKLLQIKGGWFDIKEWKKNRKQMDDHFKKLKW